MNDQIVALCISKEIPWPGSLFASPSLGGDNLFSMVREPSLQKDGEESGESIISLPWMYRFHSRVQNTCRPPWTNTYQDPVFSCKQT